MLPGQPKPKLSVGRVRRVPCSRLDMSLPYALCLLFSLCLSPRVISLSSCSYPRAPKTLQLTMTPVCCCRPSHRRGGASAGVGLPMAGNMHHENMLQETLMDSNSLVDVWNESLETTAASDQI